MTVVSEAERKRLEKIYEPLKPGDNPDYRYASTGTLVPAPTLDQINLRDLQASESTRSRTPIPATVQIGPFAFKIIASAREIRTRENHSGDQLNGQIEFEGCTIAMEPTMCRDHQASTLLHEVIHGIWWNAGHNEDSKKMTNEDIIKFLAPALLDVLRRNPALVAFLVEESR